MSEFLVGIENKYPKEILEGRLTIEGNVVACLAKDMLLVDESKLTSEDFITEDGRFYFSLIKNMRDKNFAVLDDVTILSNAREEVIAQYNERGGWDSLENIIEIVNESNYETYQDQLYRENTICKLYQDGFNVLEPVLNDKGKKIIPLKLFRRMTASEVIDWYDARLASYPAANNSKIREDGNIGFGDDFIESCSMGQENGVPFGKSGLDINGEEINCFPFLSNQILGFREGTLNIMAAHSSTGKSAFWIGVLVSLLSQGRNILIISNEESKASFEVRFLVYWTWKYNRYYKLSKKKMLTGNLTDEDKEQIKIARAKWHELGFDERLKFISVTEMDMSVNKKLIRKEVLKRGVDTVLIDTLKLDFNNMSTARTDLDLVRDSRDLDAIAKKYNIIMLCSLQLAMNSKGTLFLTSNNLSQSKQIIEVCESMLMMRNVYPEELNKDDRRYFCHPFRKRQDPKTGEWKEEKYEADPNKVWRMVFFSKTRSGSNSEDLNRAFLMSYDGDHSRFVEEAWCKPAHGMIT